MVVRAAHAARCVVFDQRLLVDFLARQRHQRVQRRGESKGGVGLDEVDRLDAVGVARDDEAAVGFVQIAECVHAFRAIEKRERFAGEALQQHFGVRARGIVAGGIANVVVVVDFAVVDDRAVRAGHGLRAAGKVDDGQARMMQFGNRIASRTKHTAGEGVGTPAGQMRLRQRAIARPQRLVVPSQHQSRYAAHAAFSGLCRLSGVCSERQVRIPNCIVPGQGPLRTTKATSAMPAPGLRRTVVYREALISC